MQLGNNTGSKLFSTSVIAYSQLKSYKPLSIDFGGFCSKVRILLVNLKSNSALLYNEGHNFWKSASTWKIP